MQNFKSAGYKIIFKPFPFTSSSPSFDLETEEDQTFLIENITEDDIKKVVNEFTADYYLKLSNINTEFSVLEEKFKTYLAGEKTERKNEINSLRIEMNEKFEENMNFTKEKFEESMNLTKEKFEESTLI